MYEGDYNEMESDFNVPAFLGRASLDPKDKFYMT
jgi:hypothetical protein